MNSVGFMSSKGNQIHSFSHSELHVAKVLLKWKGIDKASDIDTGRAQSMPYLLVLSRLCIVFLLYANSKLGFPGGSDGKASAHNAGDQGSIPGSGRSPGEGNGHPLQYSCLENS